MGQFVTLDSSFKKDIKGVEGCCTEETKESLHS